MSWLLNARTLNVERDLMDIALAGHLGLVGLFQLLNEVANVCACCPQVPLKFELRVQV